MMQKYGRPNEATPAKWQKEYTDFGAPLENGTSAPPSKPPVKPHSPDPEVAGSKLNDSEPKASQPEGDDLNGESKKRKRHEDETPEEKAERRRKKKEKKEKKEKKSRQSVSDQGE